jgi:hypothetical protein
MDLLSLSSGVEPMDRLAFSFTKLVVVDIEATMARLEKEGGRIEVPVHDNEEHGVRAASSAILKDI